MRLRSLITRSLVLALVVFASQILFAAEQSRQEVPPANLDTWLQKGDQILKATRWDPEELLQTAQYLYNWYDKAGGSSKGADALWVSAQLYAKGEKYPECVTSCQKLWESYPQASVVAQAYELAGTVTADRLGKPLQAAQLFEKRALAYPQEKYSETLWRSAVTYYEKASAWEQAADCAQKYIEQYGKQPSTLDMRIELANIWMKGDKVNQAEQTLVAFVRNYADAPQAVRARYILGRIYEDKSDTKKAYEQWNQAWTSYERISKKGKLSEEVRYAAGQALYALQTPKWDAFRDACAVASKSSSAENPKAMAEELVANYNRAMQTDPDLAMQALMAQAQIYEELGNYLLQQGYSNYANAKSKPQKPAHEAAKEEYTRAIALYERAWDYALPQRPTPELDKMAQQAASRAIDLTIGNGDLTFAWAMRLRQNLPSTSGSPQSWNERFDGLIHQVYPVLMEGLSCYKDARAAAVRMRQPWGTERTESALTTPCESFTADLYGVDRNAWDGAKATVTQIVGSVERTWEASTASPQVAQFESTWKWVTTFEEQTWKCSREMLLALHDVHSSPEDRTSWEDFALSYNSDYAAYCRELATKLDGAVGTLREKKTAGTEELQNRLRNLSKDCSAQEYQCLESAYKLSEELAITTPASDRILERLATLNPKEYRSKADLRYGTRQKP
jgi:tetratricopeptide (TPR) repeat protein